MYPETGLIHVYTGEGKGKTTAAVGLALRALGRGLRVHILQFMKADAEESGENRMLEKLTGRKVLRFGRGLLDGAEGGDADREEARLGLAEARRLLAGGDCDLLVLDEINVAVYLELVHLEDVVDLIEAKPPKVELILTGRCADPRIIELADYVTEILSIKHPFDSGIKARRGIEY